MKDKKRECCLKRKTKETVVQIHLNLDGQGKSNIQTGLPFLDHMLTLFTRHGLFDLDLKAKGDLQVDEHHTVEDCGLSLGQALKDALGTKKGIKRFGYVYAPMDETLARVCLDLSGRPNFFFRLPRTLALDKSAVKKVRLIKEFLKAFSSKAELTLHTDILTGEDEHHMAEAVFKALGLALDQASRIDPRARDIPSTKGKL